MILMKLLFDRNLSNLQDRTMLCSLPYTAGKAMLCINFGFSFFFAIVAFPVISSKAKSYKCMEKTR